MTQYMYMKDNLFINPNARTIVLMNKPSILKIIYNYSTLMDIIVKHPDFEIINRYDYYKAVKFSYLSHVYSSTSNLYINKKQFTIEHMIGIE